MKAELPTCGDYVTATFSRDFVAEGCDHDSVERIHRGDVDEWIRALAQSGLFTDRTVAHAWQHKPHSLLEALLSDADEVTVKRYEVAWQALDRAARFGYAALADEYA
ncbi:hypothetical protein GCM10023094_21560 [Rhodococcus olei]|uniref:Uncharacterized protein n=1 Tax=Rhodococcus olei TaxID=2161675 RepID=A0ABP8P1S6_9NOCA